MRWEQILRVVLRRSEAAPLQALNICTLVLHSRIFDDSYDLRYLDLPSLVDRIRYGLDNLHILKTFIEAGLG